MTLTVLSGKKASSCFSDGDLDDKRLFGNKKYTNESFTKLNVCVETDICHEQEAFS